MKKQWNITKKREQLYIKVSYETIDIRIQNAKSRGVVLKEGQTLKDLYEERVCLFEKYADYTICEDGLTIEETIGNVLKLFEE